MYFDLLESRVLFSGVTILVHGLDGNIDGWIQGAADAIQKEAGGTSAASQYVMTLNKSGGNIVVTSFTLESGNIPLDQTTAGQAIIKLDWSAISGADQNTGPVATAVTTWLEAHHGGLPDFVDMPIHLIGHSKGGSLVSEISKDLGQAGIWVDQLTALDPVGGTVVNIPFIGNEVFGDPAMASYDNVIFVDDYYQTGSEPSGQSFAGAHVTNLTDIVTADYLFGAHNGVTAYYDGTIDPSLESAGGLPILDSWYSGSGDPSRTQTGFVYSAFAGGTRPADGVSAAFGGSASRVSAGQTGSQWANVINPAITGGDSFSPGQTITLNATYDDRDSKATVTFFVDTDQNPLDGNSGTLGSQSLASTNSPTAMSMSGALSGIGAGTYYLGAKIMDADGHVRYAYGTDAINVAAPNFASVDGNGVVTVQGTPNDDLFSLTEASVNGTMMLEITRDGVMQSLPAAGISYISLDTGDGNDTMLADASCPPIYAFGGAGNDSLSGGGGNDTLTGGSGKNTLLGNDGDDRLNGSNGHDVIYGGNGSDRLYGNGGDDTLDGGGGVDRLWGGDGNDMLLGGGSNDKLYGGAGADTFNGQGGNDLFGDVDGTDSIVSGVGDTIVNALPPSP